MSTEIIFSRIDGTKTQPFTLNDYRDIIAYSAVNMTYTKTLLYIKGITEPIKLNEYHSAVKEKIEKVKKAHIKELNKLSILEDE